MSSIAIVHGRFQPLHLGHLSLILEALKQYKHVIIGISTPQICTEEYAQKTGYPCTLSQNPFSHAARVEMIRNSLAEQGIADSKYTIIAFPSDYKNIQETIPRTTVFILPENQGGNTSKQEYIQSLGYEVVLLSLPKQTQRKENGTYIRKCISTGDTSWRQGVSPSVEQVILAVFEGKT